MCARLCVCIQSCFDDIYVRSGCICPPCWKPYFVECPFNVVRTLAINQSDENLRVLFVSKCSKCHAKWHKLGVFYDSLSIHWIFQCVGDILFVLYLIFSTLLENEWNIVFMCFNLIKASHLRTNLSFSIFIIKPLINSFLTSVITFVSFPISYIAESIIAFLRHIHAIFAADRNSHLYWCSTDSLGNHQCHLDLCTTTEPWGECSRAFICFVSLKLNK